MNIYEKYPVSQVLELYFLGEKIKEPVLYFLVNQYDIMTNIISAQIKPNTVGKMKVRISAPSESVLMSAITWLLLQEVEVVNVGVTDFQQAA